MTNLCFACDKKLTGKLPHKLAHCLDDQDAFVGADCWKKIEKSGISGYQPPKGGPRLYTFLAKQLLNGNTNSTERRFKTMSIILTITTKDPSKWQQIASKLMKNYCEKHNIDFIRSEFLIKLPEFGRYFTKYPGYISLVSHG